jgi:hypothetical protein
MRTKTRVTRRSATTTRGTDTLPLAQPVESDAGEHPYVSVCHLLAFATVCPVLSGLFRYLRITEHLRMARYLCDHHGIQAMRMFLSLAPLAPEPRKCNADDEQPIEQPSWQTPANNHKYPRQLNEDQDHRDQGAAADS